MIDALVARGLFGWLKPRGQASARPDAERTGETGVEDEQDVGWVAILTIWNSADAVVVVARLQDEGIPALARPEAASSAIPVSAGMLSEIEVLVPEAMEDHALDVLWDLGFLNEQDDTDGYEDEYAEDA
jgi:hypothetical protein